jgi:hypothetical protein
MTQHKTYIAMLPVGITFARNGSRTVMAVPAGFDKFGKRVYLLHDDYPIEVNEGRELEECFRHLSPHKSGIGGDLFLPATTDDGLVHIFCQDGRLYDTLHWNEQGGGWDDFMYTIALVDERTKSDLLDMGTPMGMFGKTLGGLVRKFADYAVRQPEGLRALTAFSGGDESVARAVKHLSYGKGELALIEYAKHPGTTPLLEAVKAALTRLYSAGDKPVDQCENMSHAEETAYIKDVCEKLLKEMLETQGTSAALTTEPQSAPPER